THPSLGALLGQIRGESIEVAAPNPVRGVILGVEQKQERVGDDKVVEVEYLNLLAPDGLRSLPLSQVQRIQIANEHLDAELRQALAVLASGHDTQKKTVASSSTAKAAAACGLPTSLKRPSGRPATGSCSLTHSRHSCRAGRSSRTPRTRTGRACDCR